VPPAPVDKRRAKAFYDNGVLEVVLPVAEKPGMNTGEIPIS
jgi:HSP20 family molecular chaperone IbpA